MGQTLIALLGRRTGRGMWREINGTNSDCPPWPPHREGMWREINGTNPDCPPWPPHREGDVERNQRNKP